MRLNWRKCWNRSLHHAYNTDKRSNQPADETSQFTIDEERYKKILIRALDGTP
jgi:hypothetical protein